MDGRHPTPSGVSRVGMSVSSLLPRTPGSATRFASCPSTYVRPHSPRGPVSVARITPVPTPLYPDSGSLEPASTSLYPSDPQPPSPTSYLLLTDRRPSTRSSVPSIPTARTLLSEDASPTSLSTDAFRNRDFKEFPVKNGSGRPIASMRLFPAPEVT